MIRFFCGISVKFILSDMLMNNKQLFFFNKGQSPKKMERISIVTRQTSKSLYETDDVLQLQCIGEVENINAMPSKVGENSYANIHKKLLF